MNSLWMKEFHLDKGEYIQIILIFAHILMFGYMESIASK